MENSVHNNGGSPSYCRKKESFINQKKVQLLIVMKLFLILLVISLHVSAAALSQQITLSVKKAPLREVMQSIRKQTGYQFFIKSSSLKEAKPVTLALSVASLEDALKKIFEDQPLTYQVQNKVIIVEPKPALPIQKQTTLLQLLDLPGTVTDSMGRPLIGATIKLKEQKDKIAISDDKGAFVLKNVPNSGTLIISMIGFVTQEVNYYSGTLINIRLKVSNSSLDEIRVIAYGTTTKRLSTSNISSIKAKDIAQQPNSNPILALQGRVPGVYIQQSSGIAGSDVSVRIQGKNSIVNGTDPFYVIDGVPFTSSMLSPIGAALGAGGGSPLSFINSSDIESIEILKDADATAIYGSKAANGAILITTKKGIPGKTRLDVNVQSGWGKVPHFIKLLNTQQYLELRNEAFQNDGAKPTATNYDVNGVWDQNQNTNWQEELIGGTARFNDYRANVSGGSQSTQFNLAANYHKETTVTPGDFSDKKGSVLLNLNHKSENKKFLLQFNGNYLQDLNLLSNFDLTAKALSLPPNSPAMYNSDGSINFAPLPTGKSTFIINPAIQLAQKYHNETSNLVSNLSVTYELIPGLRIKSSFGYNKLETSERTEVPLSSIPPDFAIRERSAIYSTKTISSWIIEPQISYTKYTSFGNFDFLLGSTFQKNSSDLTALQGTGYNSDQELSSIQSASSISIWNSLIAKYNYNAIFGRANYNLNNRYILNFTMRRDGSSRFGSENLFKDFFSIGGAWIFSEEEWMKDKFPALTFAKIKSSYGTTGNDQIGDYQFLSLYSQVMGITAPYQGVQAIASVGHANPFIQWEETRKLNLGLDLSFFDRFNFNFNYYRNRSANQLLSYPLSFVTGFSKILRNIPAKVENSGVEVMAEVQILKSRDLKWTASVNLTVPQNKLLEFPDLLSYPTYANSLIIGKPITITKVFDFAGVNQQTGVYEFFDSKGNRTSNPNSLEDNTQYVNTVPIFYGGFQNSLSYKGIELDLLFQAVKQTGRSFRVSNLVGVANANQPVSALQRWKAPGDVTDIQRANRSSLFSQYAYYTQSNAGYTDASFIRLKNVSISYTFPQSILKKARVERIRIFMLAQNLLTITKYEGLDPEFGTASILPPLRVITVGAQITL